MQLKKIAFLFILFCIPFLSFSQKFVADFSCVNIPDTLIKNAKEVIRISSQDIVVKDESEAYSKYRQVITILNDKSRGNEFQIGYTPDMPVKNISATIYDANGRMLRKMSKTEIQDYSAVSSFSIYEDDRVKYFELNHSEYPYTIEVKWEQKIKGIAFAAFEDWYIQNSYHQSVQFSEYKLTTPKDFGFSYRAFKTDAKPQIISLEDKNVYHWITENIPAIQSESFGVNTLNLIPRVLVSLDSFAVGKYKGSMKSWKDYGAFEYSLWKGRDKLSEETQAEIRKRTANANSNQEKIDTLYRWMQEDMRYVSVQLGIGGWQPFEASYVERNKYGDCKALTNYMMSMLKVIDIESHPASVYAGNVSPKHEEDFASPRFNHIILYIPSEDYWLECTSNYNPPNYLGDFTENRTVLISSKEGGKLIKTPKSDALSNLAERKIEVKIAPDGSAVLETKSKLHRHQESPWRQLFFENSEEEQKKYFRRSHKLPTFQFEDFTITPNRNEPFTQLNFQVKINRYGSKAGKRFFVPINVVSPRTYVPAKLTEERKNEVVIKNGYTDKDEIIISLPAGYKAESIPTEKKEIATDFGSYSLEFQQLGNKIICLRNFTIKDLTLPAESYDTVRKFYKDVVKADKTQLVLVKSEIEVIKP